jgi:hypothetical protein
MLWYNAARTFPMSATARAALVTAECLTSGGQAVDVLRTLESAGLRPIVIAPRPLAERPDTGGFPMLACPESPSDMELCWQDEEPALLHEAAARWGFHLTEAFLISSNPADMRRAAAVGARPVLVLDRRDLMAIYGPEQPEQKNTPVARDLSTAARYVLAESMVDAEVGPFPYAPHHVHEEPLRVPVLGGRDVGRLLLVLVVASVAISLGISYFLVWLYRTQPFPEAVYYLTLQFLDRRLRGALFLLVGLSVAALAWRNLATVPRRRYR